MRFLITEKKNDFSARKNTRLMTLKLRLHQLSKSTFFVPFKNGFNAVLFLHPTLKRSKLLLTKMLTLMVHVNRPLILDGPGLKEATEDHIATYTCYSIPIATKACYNHNQELRLLWQPWWRKLGDEYQDEKLDEELTCPELMNILFYYIYKFILKDISFSFTFSSLMSVHMIFVKMCSVVFTA